MGRPLKKEFFGNTTISGQTIRGNAWVNGDTMARPSWISKQLGTDTFYWFSVDGTGPALGGVGQLVNGEITGPGQANIKIFAYGSETGTNATAIVNVAVDTVTVVVDGTGTITADYLNGELLNLVGGTYPGNHRANVTVSSTHIGAIQTNNLGHDYAVNDYFIMSGAGWTTNANVRVSTVNAAGAITGLVITNSGAFTGTKPSEPFTATTWHTASGAGATFDARFAVNSVTITQSGDYRTIPSNPVSFTGSAAGTGFTANLTYKLGTTRITNAGSGYDYEPTIVVTPDLGANVYATVSGGQIAAVIVDQTGAGYTSVPTLTFADSMATTHARVIKDRSVTNFENQSYNWLTEGNTLPGPSWAHIETH